MIRFTRWRDETRKGELLAVPISSGRLDVALLAASGPRQAIERCRSKETCMSWMQHRQKDDFRIGPFLAWRRSTVARSVDRDRGRWRALKVGVMGFYLRIIATRVYRSATSRGDCRAEPAPERIRDRF